MCSSNFELVVTVVNAFVAVLAWYNCSENMLTNRARGLLNGIVAAAITASYIAMVTCHVWWFSLMGPLIVFVGFGIAQAIGPIISWIETFESSFYGNPDLGYDQKIR